MYSRLLYFAFFTACIGVVIIASSVAGGFASAQTQQERIDERARLEAELEQLEREIRLYETNIERTQQERQTLQNQVYILRNRINQLDAQIAQSNRLIDNLRLQIGDTASSINRTEERIDITKRQLMELLQVRYQQEQTPLLEVMFSGDDLSNFFDNLVALETLNVRNGELLDQLHDLTLTLRNQKANLESEQAQEENFVRMQILQKQESQRVQQEQAHLLDVTRGQEALFQQALESRQAQARQIRNRLFELVGVPNVPTFGQAVEIATQVSAQTGVRPAFILAILEQESALGRNVGQCYVARDHSGASIGINSGRRFANGIHRTRDLPPFLTITQELGRDPYATPVSCPIPSVGGYGGAMGPAQFIPSTWMMYKSRLEAILGRTANPWNIYDAFLASALYLRDGGAAGGTRSAEYCAALTYFSGSCAARNQQAYGFYANQVLLRADRFENDIQILRDAGQL